MFIGLYRVRLRDKKRIAFPAKLRHITGDRLMITNWFEKSLLVLPKQEWERIVAEIFEKASFLLPEVRNLDQFIYGGTFELELDKEGRFVIPQYLAEYANIKKDIVITGGAWYISIWDESTFESYQTLNALQIRDKAKQVFENKLHERK